VGNGMMETPMTSVRKCNIPFSEYVESLDVNASALRAGRRSMQHMVATLTGVRKDPSPAMLLGSALHAAVLEPARFDACVTVPPSVDRRTKAGKEAYASWLSTTGPNAIVLDADDLQAVLAAAKAISESHLSDIVGDGESEVSVYWSEDTAHGVVGCKARLDWFGIVKASPSCGLIVDIKTTRDASPHAFARSAAAYGYVHQAAWYARAARRLHDDGQAPRLCDYIIVAIEMDAPYAVGIYRIAEDDLAAADRDNMDILSRYAACIDARYFPGPTESMQTLKVPDWIFGTGATISDDDLSIPF
jgi:exodeoxyribonuclease VIII